MWSTNNNTILLVDDCPDLLVLLGRRLRLQGYSVLTATNGKEALRIIGDQGPRIVITDWEMPEMNGLELCRHIRTLEAVAFTYVILLTGNSEMDQIVAGFEAGVDDYITKPFSNAELMARLSAAQRIIQAEVACEQQTLSSCKVNAQMGVMNATLQRMARLLETSRDAAQATTRAKSLFLANMSHEIRTPMTAILGFAETLLEENQPEQERREAIRTILANGQHLLAVIDDILDLSKIEAGKLSVEKIPCSPIQIAHSVAALMQPRADKKGVELRVAYVGLVPQTIQTDPTRLRQILINVVGNAIKFTQSGYVEIVARCCAEDGLGTMQFDVTDTGIGMTAEQIEAVFQPFGQADCSTARMFGGTGLGLTIGKRLAELLGGDLALVRTQPDGGSQFRVTIATGPLKQVKMLEGTDATTTDDQAVPNPWQSGPGVAELRCRVLLAEDAPDSQRLISHFLGRAGADVTVVENGQLAVAEAISARDRSDPYDVILMDMQMPIMDGYCATAELRRQGYGGPIVALTAHAMTGDRDKCMRAGCDAYATKPIDRNKLIATIKAVLGTTHGMDEKAEQPTMSPVIR